MHAEAEATHHETRQRAHEDRCESRRHQSIPTCGYNHNEDQNRDCH